MTPFHLATNLPLFMRKSDQVTHVLREHTTAEGTLQIHQ